MQQGKKSAGKQLGFLTETCSQAQAYLGIPQTFFGQQQAEHNENRRCVPRKEDAGRNGGSGKCRAGERKKRQRMAFEAPFVPPVCPKFVKAGKTGDRLGLFAARNNKKRKGCGYLPQPLMPCWCRGRESNPHGGCHYHLKIACLPIPPPRHKWSDTENRVAWQELFCILEKFF